MPQLARTLPAVLLLAVVGAAGALPDAAAGPVAASVSDTLEDEESGILLDFTVNGGTVTESVRDGREYSIRGTVRPGETISVAASGNGTTWSTWHHANEDLDATLTIDFPSPDFDEKATLAAGTSGSLAGSYVVPDDESTIEFSASISNAWVNPNGGGSRTLIVRCIFEVVEPEPSSEPAAEPDLGPQPTQQPRRTSPCDEESYGGTAGWTRESAIVRFGDLTGEVNVRPDWEDDDAYIFAELNTPLVHCDRIRTLPKSGAILSFSDMSTFVMREDSIVVLDIANERETMLGIVAGNIWVNFNRMIEDGSMEVEMAQAIAGARGTTFICAEVGGVSTVKVVEGTVEVTPNVGAPLMLDGGETVSVTASGAGPVQTFDIDAEMAGWPETAQQITTDALAADALVADSITIAPGVDGRSGEGGLPMPALILGILGLALMATGAIGFGVERGRTAR